MEDDLSVGFIVVGNWIGEGYLVGGNGGLV